MLHTLGELAYNPPFFLSFLRMLGLQMWGPFHQAFPREFLGIELGLPGS